MYKLYRYLVVTSGRYSPTCSIRKTHFGSELADSKNKYLEVLHLLLLMKLRVVEPEKLTTACCTSTRCEMCITVPHTCLVWCIMIRRQTNVGSTAAYTHLEELYEAKQAGRLVRKNPQNRRRETKADYCYCNIMLQITVVVVKEHDTKEMRASAHGVHRTQV